MKKLFITILFFFCYLGVITGQEMKNFRLDYLTLSDGLPSSSVSAIVQDDHGFMWFGTKAGLCRYNGYDFKTYTNDPFNADSLPHNQIQTMFMDKDNILWIGTFNGLSRFDPQKGSFINYTSQDGNDNSLSDDVVVAIARDGVGRLWVGTLDGLNLLDEKTGKFTRFYNDPSDPLSLPDNTVRTILLDDNGILWIGTYGGLSRWDESAKDFINYFCSEDSAEIALKKYKTHRDFSDQGLTDDQIFKILDLKIDKKTIPSNYVMSLKQNPLDRNSLIVGTWNGETSPGGLAIFDTKTGEANRLDTPSRQIYTLLIDKNNRLWAGSWANGLDIVNLNNLDSEHFQKGKDHGLSHDIIYSLYEDRSGIIWIGTNGGGIDKYVGWKNQFAFYIHEPDNPYSIPSGTITSAEEDSSHNIWFGFEGNGLSRLNPKNGLFTDYVHDSSDDRSLSNSMVNTLFRDSKNNLWIGTNLGLNRYNEKTDDFDRFFPAKKGGSLPENLIYSIAEDNKGDLWLGSYTSGIAVRSSETGDFRYYKNDKDDPGSLSDNLVRDIFVDTKGTIWISTNRGLNRYLPVGDSFKRYIHDPLDRSSISSNDVRKVFEDSDGELWVATNGGGVNHYDRKSDSFTYLSNNNGLLNNSVLGIEEISRGRLLFITLQGISIYNKNEQSFSEIDENTGLLSGELTCGYLKFSDGSLYVSTMKGVTHIPVFKNTEYSYKPQINISKLSVLGIPYNNGGKPVWFLDKVILEHQENTLSFEFSLSDYASQGKNQFAYKMNGVDSDWVYSGTRNFARYTNLSPGRYRFRVIGADSRNNWNKEGTSLDIFIKPPIWLSYYAYITYFLLVILLIVLSVLKYRKKQEETSLKIKEQKNINIELEKRVRIRTAQIEEAKRTAEEAVKAKSLFLANMSHELRTPLNAVVGFSELLNEKDLNPEKWHIVNSIKTASRNLSTLINDLLDLSKLEAGKMIIKTVPVNLSKVFYEIKHMFELRFKEKNLDFSFSVDPAIPHQLLIDETRLRQVLINLIGNSIKFTQNGFIRIKADMRSVNKGDKFDISITVEDSGCGISDPDKEKIFDNFWQDHKNDRIKNSGSGLGLSISRNLIELMNGSLTVESEPEAGTVIRIILPNLDVPEDDGNRENKDNSEIGKVRFSGIKAVIVDDIADNRDLLIEIMHQLKVSSIPAVNGKEALEIIEKEKPDIVFMDLQMPVLDGIKATEEMKKRKNLSTIPVVAVSASISNEMKMSLFSDYITKPYSVKSIRRVLENYFSERLETDNSDFDITGIPDENDKIDDIENLLIKLEEFLEDWKSLKPTGRISRVETFAEKLREVSRRHNAGFLIEYAETLLVNTRTFDLKKLEKNLARFPGMVSRLEP